MLDVQARDGAARAGALAIGERPVATPTVLHVHTAARPAPACATAVVSRGQHPTLPSIVQPGSILGPPTGGKGDIVLPRGLIYPPGVGEALLTRAEQVSVEQGATGLLMAADGPSTEAPVAVVANARARLADPWTFPAFILACRARAGPDTFLYAPGVGLPDEMALLAYAGVDGFDTAAAQLAAARGLFATPEGLMPVGEAEDRPCACPGCSADDLALHNAWACEVEGRRVRQAIRAGQLRELVETRVRSRPELVAILRRFDRDHALHFGALVPATRTARLFATSHESLNRPEVTRWVERVATRYTPPTGSKVLVVTPCSATKPYSRSPTHGRIDAVLRRYGSGVAHKVILTSPLGAVPEELELAYPAGVYDIPVTGSWSKDEADAVTRAFQGIANAGYGRVIVHLAPDEAELLADVFPDAAITGGDRPTSRESLDALGHALSDATAGVAARPGRERFIAQMVARARFQFGALGGEALCRDVTVRGKYPRLRVLADDGTQLAMLQPERGMLTLTMAGAQRIAEGAPAYHVGIDDFHPRGSVFAVGVTDADEDILPGDEVVIHHKGEVRAAGRAAMSGREMVLAKRGSAVEVRHHA